MSCSHYYKLVTQYGCKRSKIFVLLGRLDLLSVLIVISGVLLCWFLLLV